MNQEFPFAVDGKGKKKTSPQGLESPPPECGAPLEAGYMVRQPVEDMPSWSPSQKIKGGIEKAQDIGKRLGKA